MSNIDSKKFIQKNPIFKRGYGIVAKEVMEDDRLTIEAKAIYCYLCSYAGTKFICFPSIKMIQDKLKISEKRFYRHIDLLKEYGYITIDRESRKGKFQKNYYTIITAPVRQNAVLQNEGLQNAGLQNGGTNINSLKSNNLNNNTLESNMNKESYISLEDSTDDYVIEYLNQYKRKYRKEHHWVTIEQFDRIESALSDLRGNGDVDIECYEEGVAEYLDNIPDTNNGSMLCFITVFGRIYEYNNAY